MEKKYVVVLRNNGSDKRQLLKELKAAKVFSTLGTKSLLQDRLKPQAVSYHASREEAEQMKARLEQSGAVLTVEPVYQVEAWLSFDFSKPRPTDDDMLGIEIPIIARSAAGQVCVGKDALFVLAYQIDRGIKNPEIDEDELLYCYSSLTLQNGEKIFVAYSVRSAPCATKQYGAFSNSYAIYYKDMPYVLLAPTEADCLAGHFVQTCWENTAEKELMVPVGGEQLRMENPFQTVIDCGNGAPKTNSFCPACGAPAETGDRFCGKCGKKLG